MVNTLKVWQKQVGVSTNFHKPTYKNVEKFAEAFKHNFDKVSNLNEGIIKMMNRFDMDRP